MSTMLTFQDNNLSSFISVEELRKRCPMAFMTTPTNPKVSERYVHANTQTVIDDLAKLNWFPVEAKQCRTKQGSAGIRSFHMVAFQNPEVAITKVVDGNEVVDCYPRIILTNSHDGYNSFKFMVGLFRLVCSNGLVIATDKMVEESIRHINYDFEELRKMVARSIEQVGIQAKVMSDMSKRMLTQKEKYALAHDAIRLRKGLTDKDKFEIEQSSIDEVLTPTREEDKGDSLWNVFNVIQEHLMKGGFTMKNANGKARKQRGVKSVVRTLDLNKDLFRSAYSFVAKEVA